MHHFMLLLSLSLLLSLKTTCTAFKPTPVVLWHGMGDNCCNENSMGKVKSIITEAIPGVYVYSVKIGQDESEDQKRGFLDNLNRQVKEVCETLASDSNLKGGFNAVGFSQGGLFLRAYVEYCNNPPVKTLVTFGSPHAGVADIPNCAEKSDASCSLARSLVRMGVYTSFVQNRVVQAQYFKSPSNLEKYLSRNIFLPFVNNEINQNDTLKENLMSLEKFVLVAFENDEMISPPKSSWFWFTNEKGESLKLQDQEIYKKDRLGLKTLDMQEKLIFETWPGQHMQIDLEKFKTEIVEKYLNFKEKLES